MGSYLKLVINRASIIALCGFWKDFEGF